MRELLIVGGGPAGLAAAIRASQLGLDCALFEPKPPPIDKACGEGLMPAALGRLERLGVTRPDGYPIEGIRYCDAERPAVAATGDFERPGLGVRRTELHERLWRRAAKLGVERIAEPVEQLGQRGDCVIANGRRARFLIAADGLHSWVRRQVGVEATRRAPPRYGVRRHYRTPPWADRVEVHWSRRAEAYVTPVGPEAVGVAFLAEGGGRFDDLLAHFPLLVDRLDGAEQVSDDRGGGPFENRVERRAIGRVLLVGDAAGYLDPLTGEGVALAIGTATAAVEAIAKGRPASYDERYAAITREYWRLTGLLLHVARRRWLHRPMLGLLRGVPALFDGCVRLLGGRREHSDSAR